MRTAVFAAVILVATAAFAQRVGARLLHGDFSEPRAAAIDASGARLVRVEQGNGNLRVVGVDGLDAVRVQGTARASRRGAVDDVKLQLRRDGDQVVVRGVVPSGGRSWFGGHVARSLELTVQVPAGLEADVAAGTGDLEVEGVSALRARDGSGDLGIANVRGPVRVQDGSGDLELHDVGGDVWLEDGSGDVRLRQVRGSLVVGADGSGELSAEGVHGDVLVRADGSGDIDVGDVAGRLIVRRDGSGEIRYRDVRGPVDLPRREARRHAAEGHD